ncbi:MAG TPA: ATP-dependent DNA helicase RecG [Solirubrobacterales bacterium]|nr:ATP-dependent DNA helicase RecG [Solirubrobacterales bacterium]
MAASRPVGIRSFGGATGLSEAQLRDAPLRWPSPSLLDEPLGVLEGVGPKLAEAAANAGIATVGDLLLHVPHTHRHRKIVPVASLEQGERSTIAVKVMRRPSLFRRGNLSILKVRVGDDSGQIEATWFNQPWLRGKLREGTEVMLTGSRVSRGFGVSEYELVSEDAIFSGTDLMPVHSGRSKLKPQRLRDWVIQACERAGHVLEPLPAELRARRGLPGAGDAFRAIHFPEGDGDLKSAQDRLAFEELFLYQAILIARKRAHRMARPAPRLGVPGKLVSRWIESLPFAPTKDQRRALEEIDVDLNSAEPMQRLLMGEVGSGKTVVALYSMLRALEAGYQGALMAPTETLAEQHAETLDRLLGEEPVTFALLTGATPRATRRRALEQLASGELSLVVGTHALIEPTVQFARLGVCVVDEQHRFGVEQRRALDAKGTEGTAPHVLHMTATPIPRTLSLTTYGDLDTTTLRELPAGRQPIKSHLVSEENRPRAYEFIRSRLREGRQAFIVCPFVLDSEKLQGRSAEREGKRLADGEFRDFKVGVMHGQMSADRKGWMMGKFGAGEIDVLVATTVIEVGIDVPNATVMVIESAERYGITQLHQLRGRIGRGKHVSDCLLFASDAGDVARQRLEAIVAESDGFKLAEVDLRLRGEGEILGTRQHGVQRFSVAELPEDTPILVEARKEVQALLDRHGSLEAPALGPLMEMARRRFGTVTADPIPI